MGTPLGFFVIGLIAIIVCVFMGVFNLRRIDTKNERKALSAFSTSTFVWAALTPVQQKKLSGLDLLLAQELWIEENVPAEKLKDSSPEEIIVALANRGELRFGKGVSKRYASPFDLMEAEEVIRKLKTEEESTASETLTPETVKTKTETLSEKSSKGRRKTYLVTSKAALSLKRREKKSQRRSTIIIHCIKEQGGLGPTNELKAIEEPPFADNPESKEDNHGLEKPAEEN